MTTTWPSKQTGYASRYAKMHRNGVRLTVDATLSMRIIQALQALGYTGAQIAEAADLCDSKYVRALANGRRATVYLATERSLVAAYRRLGHEQLDTPSARRVRAYARQRGYAPPLAWNDITDPTDRPIGVRK
ncbi:MAG: hypothetical protein ACXVGN_00165 [Mycobacteriaceae bacterium]